MYIDQFCFEYLDEMLLLDGACYSTRSFSNSSTAFRVKIVGFGYKGGPWIIDVQEFSDDCYTPTGLSTSLTAGTCAGFLGRFRGVITPKFRSERCSGNACSTLAVAEQNFYREPNCRGNTQLKYRRFVPLQAECLAMRNRSSQTYFLEGTLDEAKIVRIDYLQNTKCLSSELKEFQVVGKCYSIDSVSMQSFSWKVFRPSLPVSAARCTAALLLPALLAVVVLQISLR